MIPFPLPTALARLHDLLERYQDQHEKGFFMAEQPRRGQVRAQPVLMFVSPETLRGPTTPGRRPPDWMCEVVEDPATAAERMASYGRAGVPEYWLVVTAPGATRVEVHTLPDAEGRYAACRVFASDEPVETAVFPHLELKPADLTAPING